MIDLRDLDDMNYYSAIRVPDSNTISVTYDDPNSIDDEHYYTFNPDGSAKAQCAFGVYPDLPAGTFSDLLLKLPKTGEINSMLAQELANSYQTKLNEIRDKEYNSMLAQELSNLYRAKLNEMRDKEHNIS